MINDELLLQIKETSAANALQQDTFLSEQDEQLNVLERIQQKHFHGSLPSPEEGGLGDSREEEGVCVGCSKTFEEMIEEQLEKSGSPQEVVVVGTKRPFLRKGEGLRRFQGKSASRKVESLPKSDYSTCSSTNFDNSGTFGGDTLKDVREFEAIEEALDNVSFISVTPSIKTKIKDFTRQRSTAKQYNRNEYADFVETSISDVSFDDGESWETLERDEPPKEKSLKRGTASAIVKRFFPQLDDDAPPKPTKTEEKTELTEKMTTLATTQVKLNKTTEELEKLKVEKRQELNRLRREMTDFEREKSRELTKLEKYKEEELTKIKRERRQFNSWVKAQRETPARAERQRIDDLENKLREREEVHCKKEKRWTCSLGRLKDRIDSLEKENGDLRREIKVFERFRYEKLKGMGEEPAIASGSGAESKSRTCKESVQGTRKVVKNDGTSYSLHYVNGDEKHKFGDRQLYYYRETGAMQVTVPGGQTTTVFANGQVERRMGEGELDVLFPDRSARIASKGGRNMILQSDGTFIRDSGDGQRVVHFSSGHVEIHSVDGKRRIYPDGSTKIIKRH